MPTPLDRVEIATWRRLAPPPRLTVSEWADRHRVLPPESSAEPGPWRTSRTPYLREIMDAIADRKTSTVVIMASSQVGKTEVLLNVCGFYMHLDHPSPMMLVEPTLEMATAVSKDRLATMLRDTPVLRGLVAPARSRDSSNTTLHKSFPGGHLTLSGANSPASLASRPIRVLLADEVDRWEGSVGQEGDPLSLAIVRTRTFQRRKIVVASTPTIKDASRIEDWFTISDQRRYYTPCPRCRERFVLAWEHVRWENRDPSTAYLECPSCAGRIEDAERTAMVAQGTWVASRESSGIAGFHVWEMFAPWRSLPEQVEAFLVSRISIETRKVWRNTSLGLTWETPGEAIEPGHLLLRREQYGAVLPPGVKIITAGVDTQDDRLEAVIVGWGAGEEAWILERLTFPGDPARQDVWNELDSDILDYRFPVVGGGSLRVQCTLVDAGGHRTQAVYSAIIPRQAKRAFVAFGRSGGEKGLLVSPPKSIKPANGTGSVYRRIVDVDQVKALIYARLRLMDPGPEYVHFPVSVGETFFDELTAEKLITRRNKFGVPSKVWEQVRPRNESLDCFVLALAALRIVAPNAARFTALASRLDGSAAEPPTQTRSPEGSPPVASESPARTPWLAPRREWLR